jgi:hypothetical protein
MQIKTQLRFHLTPVSKAITKNIKKMLVRMQGKKEPSYAVGENVN